jgi:hypothetical protein
VAFTRGEGRRILCLDCEANRPSLRAIYERFGFRRVDDRQIGPYFVSRFEFVVDVAPAPAPASADPVSPGSGPVMRQIIESITSEYRRYKKLSEDAIAQLDESDLSRPGPGNGNSIAIIAWHVSGNLTSRFTDFLTSDGEKPWREREEEFEPRTVGRAELLEKWNRGWDVLLRTLSTLADDDLGRTVTIRAQPLRVDEALHRSLAHTSYHAGQIVYLAKAFRGDAWEYLSIPPGKSAAYNAAPDREKPR